jgi:voltage-gated potassium channel
VTNSGRLLGSLIIIVGVGIFGTFTGYLANLFLAPRRARVVEALDPEDAEVRRQERLRELVAQQQATTAEIEELLRRGST